MQIEDFNHVYAVTHDFLNERSSSFRQIDASTCSLRNNTNGKTVSPYLYGVFLDERENIFGLGEGNLGIGGIARIHAINSPLKIIHCEKG